MTVLLAIAIIALLLIVWIGLGLAVGIWALSEEQTRAQVAQTRELSADALACQILLMALALQEGKPLPQLEEAHDDLL